MKTLVLLYVDLNSFHLFDKVFNKKSGLYYSLKWANSLKDSKVVLFTHSNYDESIFNELQEYKNVEVISKNEWDYSLLIEEILLLAEKNEFENILFSYADCPFLNKELTQEILETHQKYVCEYTFADGFPYGFAPEVIALDCVKLLKNTDTKMKITREGFYSLIKKDINSYEVETVLSDEDYRMYRLNFECSSLANQKACIELFNYSTEDKSINEICDFASKNVNILKTLPSYYNIQICSSCKGTCCYCPYKEKGLQENKMMDLNDFSVLIDKIEKFSENAVVSLSLWGDAVNHIYFVDFVKKVLEKPGLSVLIETDGINLSTEVILKIKEIASCFPKRTNGYEKIIWIISLDAFTKETYKALKDLNEESFNYACNLVSVLQENFPGSVYPQMLRMNENEEELESFYRYWSDKNSNSGGNVIIQKYDNFCKLLENKKPCDISPVDRNPCWHIRRDLSILVDGSVPVCREMLDENIIGNVFTEELQDIWQKLTPIVEDHIKKNYLKKCEDCDEFYTFNF